MALRHATVAWAIGAAAARPGQAAPAWCTAGPAPGRLTPTPLGSLPDRGGASATGFFWNPLYHSVGKLILICNNYSYCTRARCARRPCQ